MKFITKKTVCAFLLGCCVLGGGIGAISEMRKETASAYTIELSTDEIAKSYYVQDTLTLPDSVRVEYDGKSYVLTDGVVYYPDGTAYQKPVYELNKTGAYKVVYTLRVDGDILQAVQEFSVIGKNWQVGKEKSGVEYGKLSMTKGDYTHGLKVSLVDGDTFTYNIPVDLSKNTVNDFITIHSTQTTATAKAKNIVVRATDCYDASNYIDFYLYYAPGGSIYARAGASCNDDTGLYQSDTLEATSIRKIVYIDGVRYAAYFSNWGVSMGTGANATSDSGFTWQYNSKTQEVRVFQSRSPEGGNKVTELANADIYGDDLFAGFTTGEVYLSVFAEGYSEATVDFEIGCIDGKTGEELALADYTDRKAPVLEIDYTPTIGNAVYVAQGEEVRIFDCKAMDVSGVQIETAVYYNYESTKRSRVYLKDGVFTATQPGAYTIVYTAIDFYGNKTQQKVVVNSVKTDNGKAIDFMAKLDELFKAYGGVTKEKLWENLKYFLEAIMPTCRECDIKMAIHMDDPPWDIFGLPRLLVDEPSIDRFLKMVDDEYNCLTLCSGSLNANPENNVAEIVRKHCDRIAFAHIRNVKHFENGDFSEASHRDCDGDTGILDILKAYHDCGYKGYIRPDHGRHLWGEKPGTVRPGYGLYDRALGIMYMLGVWDMLDKLESEGKVR